MNAPITFQRQILTLEALRSLKDAIILDPHYQRQGDVWPSNKQQLLVDSLLNGFLIPPMYWHSLDPSSQYYDGQRRYAVVDGRQRLETLFAFLEDGFGMSPDNSLLGDPTIRLTGQTASRLREEQPWLYANLMRAQLEVIIIDTDDIDLIEELFSRLNEGVPLRAAEKRNRGRILAPQVQQLASSHLFFTSRLPFGNRRYRHYDLIAKFMRVEERGVRHGRVPDLRKIDLDRLFDRLRALESQSLDLAERETVALIDRVSTRLNDLTEVFHDQDTYLGSVGMVTLYYTVDWYLADRRQPPLRREEIEHFESLRLSIKGKDEASLSDKERLVADFATYSQGPTSGSYLSARLRILLLVERDLEVDEDAPSRE